MTGVLHVVTLLSADGRYGGPQTVATTLARRYGHEVWGGATAADLRAPGRAGERRFRAIGPPGDQYSLLAAPGLWWGLWRRLRPHADAPIVHVHTGPEVVGLGALAVLAARRATFVAQTHGMLTYPEGSPRARFVRHVVVPLLRHARFVVALTDAERALLVGYGLPARRVVVVPNGVDPRAAEFSAPAGPHADSPIVAFVGRLHPRKHPERFTAAAALLAGRGVRARFTVAGADEGALGAARAADPGGVAEFTGALDPAAARRVIAGADVLVLCSDVEPFGLVAIEALAAGTALLVTDTCDLAPELAAAGAALMTGPEPAEIAGGIARLLAERELRERLVAGGRALVARRYAMDVIDGQWHSLYRRAAGAARGSRRDDGTT